MLSQFEFFSFVAFRVQFCSNLSFSVLSQFEFLSFVAFRLLDQLGPKGRVGENGIGKLEISPTKGYPPSRDFSLKKVLTFSKGFYKH